MMLAVLSDDWRHVRCGKLRCRWVLGDRVPRGIWTEGDCDYRSPFYSVALAIGFHLYDDVYRMTPRAQKRLAQGRRPTLRRGGAGPVLGGKMITASLAALRPPERSDPVTVYCPRCGWPNMLTVEALHLEDWEDRGDGRIVVTRLPRRT